MDLTWELDTTPVEDFIPEPSLLNALCGDLNTHLALTMVRGLHHQPQKLLDNARFLGFLGDKVRAAFKEFKSQHIEGVGVADSEILAELAARLDTLRNKAKLSKDFNSVDALKSQLVDAGLEVRMGKNGVELRKSDGFDPAKLEALK